MHKYCVKKKSNFNVKIPVLKRLMSSVNTLQSILLVEESQKIQIQLRDNLSCIKRILNTLFDLDAYDLDDTVLINSNDSSSDEDF